MIEVIKIKNEKEGSCRQAAKINKGVSLLVIRNAIIKAFLVYYKNNIEGKRGKQMKESTHLAKVLESVGVSNAIYDSNVKNLLADKQILSRILKYTLDEFRDMELYEITNCICSDIMVESQYLDAGLSNLKKVQGTATEDNVQNEGKIFYDIRFSVRIKATDIKILVNVEAQKSTDPKSLGYNIGNRIIFYLARMISAEKETEFFKSDYDNIKKSVSIWICLSDGVEDGSIEKIAMQPSILYGKETGMLSVDLMEGYLISLRVKENVKESKNELVSMLEDLLKQDSFAEKKRKLVEKHHLIMDVELEGRLSSMCNLSERIEENAILNTNINVAIAMIRENISDEVIQRVTKLPIDRIAELREQEMCLT